MPRHSPVSTFLASLEGKSLEARWDRFFAEAIETGGTFGPFSPGSRIVLHGIDTFGDTDDEAMDKWIAAAKQQIGEGT